MKKLTFDNFPNAFSCCREANKPVVVKIVGDGEFKLYPSGKAVRLTRVVDVTDHVDFGNNDDEFLPLIKCVCGTRFPLWDLVIGIYSDDPTECQECDRRLFFKNEITVYEIKLEKEKEK